MVDAARQSDRLLAGWLNIDAVDTDSRRPDEALQLCLGLRLDLTDKDRARVQSNIRHRLAQLGKRRGMGGTAGPEQNFDTHPFRLGHLQSWLERGTRPLAAGEAGALASR